MFVDLVGSTALSGKLDPEDMGRLIRAYQDCCTEVVKRWDGHVAQYMGDGVLAYFGWPRAHEDDAERAVRAGLDMTGAVGRLTGGGAPLCARVGIATGVVMVGELIGEGAAQQEAVVGETPNLAARLQAIAAPGNVVIDSRCRQLIGGLFEYADLGGHDLKGFAEPIQAWRVTGESRAESRFDALHGEHVTALVGREHEIGLLVDRWERAKEGEGQVVLLSGEPGIGKSRIAHALRERLAGQPHTALSHYCSPHHTNSALYPVIRLLERGAGFAPDDGADAKLDKLEALLARGAERRREAVPLVAALLEIETGERYPPLELSPQRQKQRTLEVLVDQVGGLAAEQPVLAIYEDVHWIDPTTLEVLGLLIERVQRLPILVLITFRPEFDSPWTGHAHVMQLSLSRLTRRHGQALVAAVTGGKALPDEVLDQIVEKTDGVPLFLEELTKTVLESGALVASGDHFDLAGRASSLAIPSTLRDSLMARLDRLGSGKEVAQVGAAIGREFTYDLLAAVSRLPDTDLTAALDHLVASELIFRRGTPPDVIYRFRHVLVQDAAYQSLLKSKRQQLHRIIAETLQARFSEATKEQPQVLAHHFTHAGLPAAAIPLFLAAAKHAVANNANREAERYCSLGLEPLQQLPEDTDRDRLELDLRVTSGAARMASLGPPQPQSTRTAHERIRELAEKVDDPSSVSSALHGVWQAYTTAAVDHGRAADVARQMLSVGERHANREAIFQGRRYLGTSMFFKGLLEQAHHEFELAMRAPHRRDDDALRYSFDAIASGKSVWSVAHWISGHLGRADELASEALQRATATNNMHTEAFVKHYACNILLTLRREFATASQTAEESMKLATEYGFPHFLAMAKILRGTALVLSNADRSGGELAREGLGELEHVGWRLFRSFFLSVAATADAHVGDVTSAKARLSEAHQCDLDSDERWAEAEIWRAEGELLASEGQVDDAEACYRRAIDIARTQKAKSWELRTATSLARLWRDEGKRGEAHDLLAPTYAWFTEGFDTADLKDAKALLDDLG